MLRAQLRTRNREDRFYPHVQPLPPPISEVVWRASPFTRARKGLVSCLHATCSSRHATRRNDRTFSAT